MFEKVHLGDCIAGKLISYIWEIQMVEFRYLGKCLLQKLYIWDRINLENCENGN